MALFKRAPAVRMPPRYTWLWIAWVIAFGLLGLLSTCPGVIVY
jgi:hypothetical protein